MEIVHTPVLLEETLQYLAPRSEGELMVDATLGEGGHSAAFLSRFPSLRMVGIDADQDILQVAKERLRGFGDRVHFYAGWAQDFFAHPPQNRPDTVLIDLGISRYHYEKSRRGFSFRKDEVLDMRIDPDRGLPAAELLARLPEQELADLFYNYGGERYSRRIARAVVAARSRSALTGSAALAELVFQAVPAPYRRGALHPATKVFQALRIAVNEELSRLQDLLEGAFQSLQSGGRLGVISFHALEGRILKRYFREKQRGCPGLPEAPGHRAEDRPGLRLLTRRAVAPTEAEVRRNPPSRSATLRVIEKVLDGDR